MQQYLFVSSEDHYTRDYTTPEELKAAAKGDLQIFKLNKDEGTVERYDPVIDDFEEVRRTF